MSPRRNKPPPKKKETPVEDQFASQLEERGIEGFQRQARFIPRRKYQADFYNAALKLCVEIDGGVFLANSGHTSGKGYTSDRRRDLLALQYGIQTLRFTTEMVRDQSAVAYLESYIPQREQEVRALAVLATSTDSATRVQTK